MAIHESRHHRLTGKIDDLGLLATHLVNGLAITDGDNPGSSDGHRLGFWLVWVDSHDVTVCKDEVRGLRCPTGGHHKTQRN